MENPVKLADVDLVRAIARFAQGFSLEATRPSAQEIAALTQVVPRGTQVYVSAVTGRPHREQIDAAIRLRAAGFEPIPHLAARDFASIAQVDDFLAELTGAAGVERLLVIAGDRDRPAGELAGAIDVIDGALLRRRGIVEIGLAAYPDGHPRIPHDDLERALIEKVDAAESTGLAIHLVTQFCFDPGVLLAWLGRLRDFGFEHRLHIGLAGPTSLATLTRYARRCGVRLSLQNFVRHAGLASQLFRMWAPEEFVRSVAEHKGQLGEIKPHFFSFGGLLQTARWASAVAQGQITLKAGAGFNVKPSG
jgi:methylenetetrahydrofolate reductase (NADPH)